MNPTFGSTVGSPQVHAQVRDAIVVVHQIGLAS
jgi:hypothetical protein